MTDKQLKEVIYFNPFRKNFSIERMGNNVVLVPENEEEENLLPEITNTIINKIKRLKSSGYDVEFADEKTTTKRTLQFCFEKFYNTEKKKQQEKYLTKFRQLRDLMYMFFGETKDITKISPEDVVDFVDFLLSFPKDYKNKKELRGKNIKLLIQKQSKILDKFPRVSPSTVDEHIKKSKTFFNYLLEIKYIYSNPFLIIKKQSNKKNTSETDWLPFEPNQLKELLKEIKQDPKKEEDYNLMKLCLYTGFRREELSILKVKDIQFDKGYIDFNYDMSKIKTENSKRIVPIHKDIEDLLKHQMKAKSSDDFIFFNKNKWKEENRGERIGGRINEIILKYFDNDKDIKKHYNLHSIRKNFIQTLFIGNQFQELDYKTIIGHSTRSDITDKHYLMGKRDYKSYKEKIDKIDFGEFFDLSIIKKIKEDNDYLNMDI